MNLAEKAGGQNSRPARVLNLSGILLFLYTGLGQNKLILNGATYF